MIKNKNPNWHHIINRHNNKNLSKVLQLKGFIEYARTKTIVYPTYKEVTKPFRLVPFNSVKVVILDLEPYSHIRPNGLAFSVNSKSKVPNRLIDIYKELNRDLSVPISKNGDLTPWAKQGVLLLNSILTVEKLKPLAHQGLGWENLTSTILEALNKERNNLVFISWNKKTHKLLDSIDKKRHLVLKATGPIINCGHFSKTNIYLKQYKKKTINWRIL